MCRPPTPHSAPPPPCCEKALTDSISATTRRPVRVFMSRECAPPFICRPVSLFRQLENRNRVTVREPHLEIATRGDGDVLNAIHHISNGRRVDTCTQVEPPQLRAARGVKGVKVSVAFAHEHKVAGRGQRAANQRLFGFDFPAMVPLSA